MDGLIVDNFAGGGGASTGIEAALGRAVDIAINHDEEAIRMHEVNHPGTVHIRNNIWQIDPREVTGGRKVSLAWFSPDCKHFSKAKGGKPREKSIRDLAWVVVLWAQRVKPDLILLENVEEFRTWGPLCEQGYPIKERAGETFKKWSDELRKAGYNIQWKELRACDYGAPTIRKRFFMIARRDGLPIVWPAPTHGKPDSPDVLSGKLKPWRTAAEIIDWSIPCPSIFERKKPLAEKTLRRIAHGIMKFVVNNPAPFIVPLTHHQDGARGASTDQPMATVTGANRGEHAIVTPFFARTAHGDVDRNGKRRGQGSHGPEEPYPTVTQSGDSALIVPHITKFRSGAVGHDIAEPLHTVTANSFVKRPGGSAPLGVVAAVLERQFGKSAGADPQEPMPTITAGGGGKTAAVAAFLSPFYGEKADGRVRSANAADQPIRTQSTENRFGVICAHIEQANGGPKDVSMRGRRADDPLSTVTASGTHQRVVTSNLIKLRGTCQHGHPTDEPLHTVSAGGTHMAEVRAFLIKYYGNEQDGHGLDSPIGTVTVQDRFGLVTVTIAGEEYVIVDIGMRMLSPRELFNAQGFPPDYIIDRDAEGRPITKTAQVAKCGNSVCPPLSEALVRANVPGARAANRRAA
ncbi:DNA cytosine methyltransferase [Altererythrobacter xixiisoli]|uniref:DNA (cytosine-5-)-methyltransferase n=2 Tax=Croceibacterium xixiisoli TaxID=1476466 RepID=A0A6I4TUU7_9SPHN|nr:DNA cytosine methyltransferase [Croceibacterium xixiisoli]